MPPCSLPWHTVIGSQNLSAIHPAGCEHNPVSSAPAVDPGGNPKRGTSVNVELVMCHHCRDAPDSELDRKDLQVLCQNPVRGFRYKRVHRTLALNTASPIQSLASHRVPQ